MQCNIDARGKAARLIAGLVLTLLGAAMLWQGGDSTSAFWIGLILVLTGAIGIFEGWAGWCIVRAAGFRTRI